MRSRIPILVVAVLLAQAGGAWADNAIGADEVWQLVGSEPDQASAQRAQILRVLEHPATQEVARQHGLDLKTAEAKVGVLDGPELEQVAQRAALAESQLEANGAIVMNETTLIIILLCVIILMLLL